MTRRSAHEAWVSFLCFRGCNPRDLELSSPDAITIHQPGGGPAVAPWGRVLRARDARAPEAPDEHEGGQEDPFLPGQHLPRAPEHGGRGAPRVARPQAGPEARRPSADLLQAHRARQTRG